MGMWSLAVSAVSPGRAGEEGPEDRSRSSSGSAVVLLVLMLI